MAGKPDTTKTVTVDPMRVVRAGAEHSQPRADERLRSVRAPSRYWGEAVGSHQSDRIAEYHHPDRMAASPRHRVVECLDCWVPG